MPLPPISPSGVSTALVYPKDTGGGPGLTDIVSATPGAINAPVLFEPGPDLTGNQLELWIIATGASANWGGCQVWLSVESGGTGTYGQIGTIRRGGVQGTLTSSFASGADPDTTHTLSVDLSASQGLLIAGTSEDADDFVTLCYCDGELLAYSAATLTSAFHYDLATYIRRGLYGTAIGAHASGSQFARVAGPVFVQQYPANLVGKTIYLKFPSFNSLGLALQDLAGVPHYSYTLTGNGVGATGGPGTCPVLIGLAAGCSEDWGSLDETAISHRCDWGVLGTLSTLQIDLGLIGA
jgi:hypothetical protein